MKLIFEYIKKYKITYIGVIVIFIIGMIIGVCMCFKVTENEKQEIKDYLQESMETFKNNQENKKSIFAQTFFNNIKFSFIVWLLGCTVIAGFTIYILMIYKGFLIGYIISIIISIFGVQQGFNYLFPLLILQNIVFIPSVFLLATSGIRLYKGIIKKELDLKYEILRHFLMIIVALAASIISACIQAYLSTIFL